MIDDPKTTDWLPKTVLPAYVGWYDVMRDNGTVRRYWRGRTWWAMEHPSIGINTDIVGVPGTHWRGLCHPAPGVHYEPCAGELAAAIAYRILLTGK